MSNLKKSYKKIEKILIVNVTDDNVFSVDVSLLFGDRHYSLLQTHYGLSNCDSVGVCSVCQQLSYGTKRF